MCCTIIRGLCDSFCPSLVNSISMARTTASA